MYSTSLRELWCPPGVKKFAGRGDSRDLVPNIRPVILKILSFSEHIVRLKYDCGFHFLKFHVPPRLTLSFPFVRSLYFHTQMNAAEPCLWDCIAIDA